MIAVRGVYHPPHPSPTSEMSARSRRPPVDKDDPPEDEDHKEGYIKPEEEAKDEFELARERLNALAWTALEAKFHSSPDPFKAMRKELWMVNINSSLTGDRAVPNISAFADRSHAQQGHLADEVSQLFGANKAAKKFLQRSTNYSSAAFGGDALTAAYNTRKEMYTLRQGEHVALPFLRRLETIGHFRAKHTGAALWLNSPLQEVLLPGSAWQQIYEEIREILASKTHALDSESDRAACLYLLGRNFVQETSKNNPPRIGLLEEPNVNLAGKRELLQRNARELFDHVHDVFELEPFYRSDKYLAFKVGLELALHESLRRRIGAVQTSHHRNILRQKVSAAHKTGGLLDAPAQRRRPRSGGATSSAGKVAEIEEELAMVEQELVEVRKEATFHLHAPSRPSTIMSEALVALLPRRDSYFDRLMTMVGSIFPQPLRVYIWDHKLFDSDFARKCRTKIISRAAAANLENPNESTVSNVVLRKVGEVLRKPLLRQLDLDILRDRLCNVLNQYYVYSGDYSPRLVYLALPIVLVYPDASLDDLVSRFCLFMEKHVPKMRRIHQVCLKALLEVASRDPQLNKSMMKCYKEIDPSFVAKKTAENRKFLPRNSPAALVEEWLAHAFVGTVNIPTMLYMWDQVMLLNMETMYDFTMSMLALLRKALIGCDSLDGLYSVVEELPSKQTFKSIKNGYSMRVTKQVVRKHIKKRQDRAEAHDRSESAASNHSDSLMGSTRTANPTELPSGDDTTDAEGKERENGNEVEQSASDMDSSVIDEPLVSASEPE